MSHRRKGKAHWSVARRQDGGIAQREAQVRAEIIQYLELRHYFPWLTHNERFPPVPEYSGIPDIMFTLNNGSLVAIEVKKPGEGIVSEKQERFMAELHRRRVLVITVGSVEDLISSGF